VLAKLKVLRGTWFDPFGHTAERQQERELIGKYLNQMDEILKILASRPDEIGVKCYQKSIELARLPDDIRGFGHVKVRHVVQAMEKWQRLATELGELSHSPQSDGKLVP
jgi:indolepyruvate ferredoxin oxidoreductase